MPTLKPWLDPHGLPADMALGRIWGRLRIVGYETWGIVPGVIGVCQCGEIVPYLLPACLREGSPTACLACLGWRLPGDMALGHIWGQLCIVNYAQRLCGTEQRTYVGCLCRCGERKASRADHLRSEETTSCGCHRRAKGQRNAHAMWQAVRAGTKHVKVGRPRKRQQEAA